MATGEAIPLHATTSLSPSFLIEGEGVNRATPLTILLVTVGLRKGKA